MPSQLLSTADARKKLGNCGRTKLYDLIAEKKLDARKFGSRTMITEESVDRLIAGLPVADLKTRAAA